jgi:hypothetical protein
MATRDQLLCRLHDGELEAGEAGTLRSQLTDEEMQKLHALAEVDALIANTLTAEAQAYELDLWQEISAKLPVAPSAPAKSKVLPFLRRRTVQVTAILSTLAAAAGLVFLLRPAAYPSNHCDIEELDVAGQNATVISVSDENGHETALIWFDHQETDEWESL